MEFINLLDTIFLLPWVGFKYIFAACIWFLFVHFVVQKIRERD